MLRRLSRETLEERLAWVERLGRPWCHHDEPRPCDKCFKDLMGSFEDGGIPAIFADLDRMRTALEKIAAPGCQRDPGDPCGVCRICVARTALTR